jgi:tetratricopeptide (TPR) repeat protein
MQRFKDGLYAFEHALKIDPNFEPGKNNMRHCLQKLGISSNPLLEVEQKLDNVMILVNKNEYAQAEAELKKILEISPTHARALMYLGNLRVALKRYDEAKAIYEKILSKNPDNVPILGNLGVLYIYEKRYMDAKQIYERIVSLTRGVAGYEVQFKEASTKIEELSKF